MQHTITLHVSPEEDADEQALRRIIAHQLDIDVETISAVQKRKRSIDARSRHIKIQLQADVYVDEIPETLEYRFQSRDVANARAVLIVGAGPAGLFAALRLIELGLKPIILERGKDVKARRRDLAVINREHRINPDSNYCFGEGGAGTYSDGKLYTRSTKRGDVRKVLETLVAFGASDTILVEAHPHIGTNKLPQIIVNIRESIINAGGEVHFNTRVTDFVLRNNAVEGVITADGREFLATDVILATGHSARDIFELLAKKNIRLEAKPFAMGVRIEHPQTLIDEMQYRSNAHNSLLPPAAYSWVEQVKTSEQKERGVFSFCMCPGGIIAPCATAEGEVVTNGWSPSKRNNPFANSGVVVALDLADFQTSDRFGALSGLRFQQELERIAFEAGGRTQTAPAQRMVDFVNGKLSQNLPKTSYQPGIVSAPLHEVLPPIIGASIQTAFRGLSKKMKPYFTNEAVVHGVESRTSSPVRIPRNAETLARPLEHPDIAGLYPCAEGAGFAGGIVSAAIDGQKCASAIARKWTL
jgi:uncharacterized FAD-dependent dehydrogenase